MKRRILPLMLGLALLASGCGTTKKSYYTKTVVFPEGTTNEQKIDMAARLVPTPQQLAWQQLELTAFIHFGINTFTSREWGDGSESPALFNPTEFDAEQWVIALKEAGFKMLILTAKHHDGFCLWPTKTTTHSVASSPWKDGKGDIVKEVREACAKHHIKFGVYLSPWDRNAKSYGDSPRYNDMFVEQLTELLTQYGEVHEVWFDGANAEGPNGKKQIYDWERFYSVIEKLQPNAVKAIMGDDIRWVGNERGLGRETEWSATPLRSDITPEIIEEHKRLGISATAKDLGSRELVHKAQQLYWYPSEVDVSIRPGWFYHAEQDNQVKSVEQLVDIYFKSVGMNSVLLLNIPPDKRGLIHENDIRNLREFGQYISKTFANNFLDNMRKTWTPVANESIELGVKPNEVINVVMLQEDITKGQRVEAFKVEGLFDSEWKQIAEGTTIGYKRLLRFEECTPSKIRVTILGSRAKANITHIGAYYGESISKKEAALHLSDLKPNERAVINNSPLTLDFGKEIDIKGFSYSPIVGSEPVFEYQISVSADNVTWNKADVAEFSNIKNNPIPQIITFAARRKARYFKIEVIRGTDGGKPTIADKQIGIFTK